MQEHPNATMARKALEGMRDGDLTGQMEFLADDVVWRELQAQLGRVAS